MSRRKPGTARRTLAVLLAALIMLSGCSGILEGERIVTSQHDSPSPDGSEADSLTAEDFDSLLAAVRNIVSARRTSGEINIYSYPAEDGALDPEMILSEAERVRDTLLRENAFCAFSVEDITFEAATIVSYAQLHVSAAYRRTEAQAAAVVSVPTVRYLRTRLLDVMSELTESTVISTTLASVTAEEIIAAAEEAYYENPAQIPMLPITEVRMYPEFPPPNAERIFEISFGYSHSVSLLQLSKTQVAETVGDIARRVSGDSDEEIVYALAGRLAELAEYDSATASLPDYSTQNFSATAYGALLEGRAVAEGYAMAMKALCDELNISCRAVRGTLDGRRRVWNLVTLGGKSYHLDAAMCDEEGAELYFLRSDADFAELGYEWAAGLPAAGESSSFVPDAAVDS
ncbi:MAG: transglutaminase-like domain-containing protein [Oscillospiraceae bacterium]|jgi:hypothetical protein|nr:transglutaminase-like domain-containing protein [Oscillospiraceae bacterium]